jgi:hypothetical protein
MQAAVAPFATLPSPLDSRTQDNDKEPTLEEIMGISQYQDNPHVSISVDEETVSLDKFTTDYLTKFVDVGSLTRHDAYLMYEPDPESEPKADAIIRYWEYPDFDADPGSFIHLDVFNTLLAGYSGFFEDLDEGVLCDEWQDQLGVQDFYIARTSDIETRYRQRFYLQDLPTGVLGWDTAEEHSVSPEFWFSTEQHKEFLRKNVIDTDRSIFS